MILLMLLLLIMLPVIWLLSIFFLFKALYIARRIMLIIKSENPELCNSILGDIKYDYFEVPRRTRSYDFGVSWRIHEAIYYGRTRGLGDEKNNRRYISHIRLFVALFLIFIFMFLALVILTVVNK